MPMFSYFKKRKIARKLASIGSHVESTFVVYLNNDEPVSFLCRSSALQYVADYRLINEIFHFQFYRIETYSL